MLNVGIIDLMVRADFANCRERISTRIFPYYRKTHMTKWCSLRASVLAAAAGFFIAFPEAQAQTALTLSSWVPGHLMTTEVTESWFRQIEKASGGRIRSTLLPKAVASPPGTFDAVRDGLADVSFILHGMMPGRFTLTKVAEFAQLGDTGEVNAVAYQRIHAKYLAGAGEHKGVKVLAVFTHGPGNILTTSKPVMRPEDLRGLKFRTGGGFPAELLKAYGAVPIVRSGGESYELLANGVVDATLLPYETIATFNLDKVIRHITVVPGGMYNLSWAVIMNQAKFDSLPQQDKALLEAWSGERYARFSGRAWDLKDTVGREVVRKANIDTRTADAAFVADMVKRAKVLEAQWVQEAKKKGVDGAAVLEAFRAELRTVAAGK
jgi:TRAP-type transport system periplasmic protein